MPQDDPDMAAGTHMLAVARDALRAGQVRDADMGYRRCLADGLPVELEYAGLLLRTGRHAEAEAILDGALGRSPGAPDLLLGRALARTARGRLGEALADYDALLAQHPDHTTALFNRASVLFRLERLEDAAAAFLHMAALDPGASDALANAGVIRLRQDRPGEAADLLRKAHALTPGRPQLMRSLANALRECGELDEALALHREVEAATPDDPAALTDHALCLLSSGRAHEAGRYYARALRIDPGDQTALTGQYMAAVATGDTARAAGLMDYPNLLGFGAHGAKDDLDLGQLRAAVLKHPELIWEPAGRSTRMGQQSTMLDLGAGSAFEPFGRMLERFVEQRMAELTGNPGLREHPWLSSRPSRWRLQAWVTVLHHGGWQSPHIHPAGWMSGVFYLDAGEAGGGDEGSIVFGHLPDDVGLEVTPLEYRHRPEDGQLISFPSYFLHHTVPYTGAERPRISLAYDVIPLR